MSKQPTLSDVARYAGVSLATVSRALNGSTRKVSKHNYDKVVAAAAALGYSVNISAQATARGTMPVIALLVADILDPYFSAIARGVTRAADDNRLAVTITVTERDTDREMRALRALSGHKPRGIIIASSRSEQSRNATRGQLDRLIDSKTKIVALGPAAPGVTQVLGDNTGGAGALAEAMVRLGYRRAVVLGGAAKTYISDARIEGFTTAFRDHGGDIDDVVYAGYGRDAAQQAMAHLLGRGIAQHTLIFAITDTIALGAIRAIREAERTVGDDIAVAGFGDVDVCRDLTPTLTSVNLDLEEVGYRAGCVIVDETFKVDEPVQALPVVRGSTPPVHD